MIVGRIIAWILLALALMALGAEIATQVTDREEWAEQRQQFTVPRESLVSEIKARLSRD